MSSQRLLNAKSVLIYALASFCLLEISITSAVLLLGSLIILIQFGLLLTDKAGFVDVGVGVAFVVGSGVFVVIGQMLIISGTPPYLAHGLAILTMGALGVAGKSFLKTSNRKETDAVWNESQLALSIAMLVTASRHAWMIPFAIALLLAERLAKSEKPTFKSDRMVVPLLAISWLCSWAIRPDRWWYFYQGNDSQFFESVGWSVAHWGIFEHPGLAGGSIADYHWLLYAINGSLSHLALLAPWEALMKLDSSLLAFLFVSILMKSSGADNRHIGAHALLIIFIVSVFMPGARVDSFAFSILVAMCFLHVAKLCDLGQSSILQNLVLVILSLALVLAKVSTALVMTAFLVMLIVVRFARHEVIPLRPTTVLLSTLAFTYILLFRTGPANVSLLTLSPNMSASLDELQNLLENPSILVQVVIWLLAMFAVRRPDERVDSRIIALGAIMPAGICFQVVQASRYSSYFGLPGIYFGTFVFIGLLLSAVARNESVGTRKLLAALSCLAIVGIFAGMIYRTAFNRLEIATAPLEPLARSLLEVARNSGYIVFACGLVIVAGRLRPRLREVIRMGVIVLLMSMSLGIGIDGYRRATQWGPEIYTKWSSNSAPFPSRDLIEIGRQIRMTTPQDVVLASNNFCCAGLAWWEAIATDPEGHSKVESEAKWGGANYLLPAETRRRFLIQGLRFQTGSGIPTSDQMRRVTLSLDFANRPSQSVAQELKSLGVSGFVVNLSLTENRDWASFAVEKFRSGDFLYLELT